MDKRLAMCVLVSLSALVPGVAQATEAQKTNCVVTRYQYDENRLALWCSGDGTIYYAFTTSQGTGCPVQTAETMKIWVSMAQTSLLSGKSLDFWSNTSCTTLKIMSWGMSLH